MKLIECPIRDFKMLLDPEDPGLSAELLEHGTREGEVPALVSWMVQPDWTCIDIGANLGFYAFIEAAKGARVYAIEPVPGNLTILEAAAARNGFERLSVHPIAIGDHAGMSEFYQTDASNWGSLADKKARSFFGDNCEVIKVYEVTLDEFVEREELSRIDLLRLDVEGGEIEVLEGAQATLDSMAPGGIVLSEFHPRCFDDPMTLVPTLNNLLEHGFRPRCIVPRDDRAHYGIATENFAEEFCRTYADDAPNIFWVKA